MRDPIVSNIVGRCHVGESNRRVIRKVASYMKNGVPGFLRLRRAERKNLMRMIVEEHTTNRNLYHAVMTGGI